MKSFSRYVNNYKHGVGILLYGYNVALELEALR
jgi:hypothetical protein